VFSVLIKSLVRASLIFSAGIIPAIGASGPSDQTFWLATTPAYGPGSVQAMAGVSHDDQLLLSSVHGSGFSLSGFWGEGKGLSSLGSSLSLVEQDASLFHGNYQRPAHFSGAAFDFRTGGVQFTAGVSQVGAVQTVDRISWFAGATSGALALQLYRVDAENTEQAHALGLQLRLPVGELQSTFAAAGSDASSANLRWQRPLGRHLWLGFEVRDGRSNRFGSGEYQRWIVNFSSRQGSQDRLLAREGGTRTTDIATTVALAAGAVGIALVATSGSESSDNQLRFSTQHDAARNVLNGINPTSVAENREYGGWVYRNGDNTFSATEPIKGTVDSVSIGPPSSVGAGTATATYHTHGGFDPRFDSENFSFADISLNNNWGVDGYLGTPGGLFKFHHFLTGVITTLGTIAN